MARINILLLVAVILKSDKILDKPLQLLDLQLNLLQRLLTKHLDMVSRLPSDILIPNRVQNPRNIRHDRLKNPLISLDLEILFLTQNSSFLAFLKLNGE